jgi:5-formyltetrahydrofolate cyclo-ligase
MDSRKNIRKTKLGQRDALSAAVRQEKSTEIRKKLWTIGKISRAKHIMIYVNFRSEVETFPLFAECLGENINISVPLTIIRPPQLIPYEIIDPAHDLRPGYCHIPEPDTDRLTPADPANIDIVLVPGSVFDPYGGRLGYGGGYYDRFFANIAPNALRVALAFEMQIVESVPVMDHDVKMHYLVTENNLLKI